MQLNSDTYLIRFLPGIGRLEVAGGVTLQTGSDHKTVRPHNFGTTNSKNIWSECFQPDPLPPSHRLERDV